MGIVGLGSGIFGYLGPQMLGYLRDATGGFTAGWIFVACAAVLSLVRLADAAAVQHQTPAHRVRHSHESLRWASRRTPFRGKSSGPPGTLRGCSKHEPGPTPIADRFMEDVFDRRIRVIFDRLCAGAWSGLHMVVIPRTSEQEHKLYLYLREAVARPFSRVIPELYLYNLLHTRSPESYSYGLERTHQMVRDFEVSDPALCEAIAESNRARAVVRQILPKASRRVAGGIGCGGADPRILYRRLAPPSRIECPRNWMH